MRQVCSYFTSHIHGVSGNEQATSWRLEIESLPRFTVWQYIRWMIDEIYGANVKEIFDRLLVNYTLLTGIFCIVLQSTCY